MARLNSLMEWIDQTKKFSKSVDYLCLDIIDSIMKVRCYADRKVLYKNKEFFRVYCDRYHKPNPLRNLLTVRGLPALFRKAISGYISESIKRADAMQKAVEVQWFEVIDFIYERPELVDPRILQDEYVRVHIEHVCSNKRKNNPLTNGMASKLGKYWQDTSGRWRPERRKRF